MMKNTSICTIFVFSLFVVGRGMVTTNAVYADSQKTQDLQMHLDKVMDELNNNNTQGAKTHLQGAQMMIASMNEGTNSTMANLTGVANNTG
ncbi:MAG: hypothetical protein L0H53_10465 [Candidatus Nitrosocosmicus sp.]|nr:hypothetical protein [Candidatus Nitrosocosmicus sp.]MDN5868361.1 hypothetical protein [Candidatus Nitrosocosmicus sp.]